MELRWQGAQKKEAGFWIRPGVLDSELERIKARYVPVINELSRTLKKDAKILDVGCGPTCAGRFFPSGNKTYIDPLMDIYLEAFPERLPPGERLKGLAEAIPKEDNTFDLILCINALDHMIDPEKALLEMRRVLKPRGILLLGIFLHPRPIAMVRRIVERYLPFLREEAHPYSFTLRDMRSLLEGFFSVEREIRVFRKENSLFPRLHREDWAFICRKA